MSHKAFERVGKGVSKRRMPSMQRLDFSVCLEAFCQLAGIAWVGGGLCLRIPHRYLRTPQYLIDSAFLIFLK